MDRPEILNPTSLVLAAIELAGVPAGLPYHYTPAVPSEDPGGLDYPSQLQWRGPGGNVEFDFDGEGPCVGYLLMPEPDLACEEGDLVSWELADSLLRRVLLAEEPEKT